MESKGQVKVETFTEIKYVGSYLISGKGTEGKGCKFMFVKKPNVIYRFFCRILLGWVWEDES